MYVGIYRDRSLGSSVFTLNTGAEYSQGGWKLDDDNIRRIHYISAPLGLRAYLGPVFLQAGPTIVLRLGETYTLLGEDALTEGTEADFLDLQGHLGLGVKFGPVAVEGRYKLGFLGVTEDGLKNANIQLGAAVFFGRSSLE